jgi:hypothetical protein
MAIREFPLTLQTIQLLSYGAREGLLVKGSPRFQETLNQKQNVIFEKLGAQRQHLEILEFIQIFNKPPLRLDKNHPLFFEVYLPALFAVSEQKPRVLDSCLTILLEALPTEINDEQLMKLITLIDYLQTQGKIEESISWIKIVLDTVQVQDKGQTPILATPLLKWSEECSRQGFYQETLFLFEWIRSHLPHMVHKIFDLILQLPKEFLDCSPLEVAPFLKSMVTSRRQNLSIKVNRLIFNLLEKPFQTSKLSYALDFLDLGFNDSLEVQAHILGQCPAMPIGLVLRSWRSFRVRFQELLTQQEAQSEDPVVVKCLVLSQRIFDSFKKGRSQDIVREIDLNISFYEKSGNLLVGWVQSENKQKWILDDLISLFSARLSLLSREESMAVLEKLLKFRLKLFGLNFDDTNKEILSEFDLVLGTHLMKMEGDSLFYIEGLKIFTDYIKRTPKNNPAIVSAIILAIHRSEKLVNWDQLIAMRLIDEICTLFCERHGTTHDARHILAALNQHIGFNKGSPVSSLMRKQAKQGTIEIHQPVSKRGTSDSSSYFETAKFLYSARNFAESLYKIIIVCALLGVLVKYLQRPGDQGHSKL